MILHFIKYPNIRIKLSLKIFIIAKIVINQLKLHKKLAWENSRYFAALPLVFTQNKTRGRSAEIPYWWGVNTHFEVVVISMELRSRLSDVISRGNQWCGRQMSAVFTGYKKNYIWSTRTTARIHSSRWAKFELNHPTRIRSYKRCNQIRPSVFASWSQQQYTVTREGIMRLSSSDWTGEISFTV